MEPIPERQDNEVGFDLAAIGSRIGAKAIDAFVGIAVYIAVFFFVFATYDISLEVDTDIVIPDNAARILRWVPVLVWAAYDILLIKNRGQTVGKMVTKIKVITASGDDPPPLSAASIRWAVLALPMTVIPDLIGLFISLLIGFWFVWDANRQGVHDKAASTYVVNVAAPTDAAI
ncbi:MAG: RDD family protein [Acidimicrobiia bacterium]|nr:RDD family protein [Acidimicrobiia bacterium]NNF08799.1 RDD family protein [Acidimicrobiia bacterium]NNL69108.1 RDD family protein [Acidimicrobiia bacterium]